MTAVLEQDAQTVQRVTEAVELRKKPSTFRADLILTLICLEAGIAIGLGVDAQPWSDWTNPATMITAVSRVAAMAGTAFALVSILLSSRIAWIENQIGQDRLIKWHRTLGPYSLWLILMHVILVTVGYSMMDGVNAWSEFWNITLTFEWMVPALLGFIFMMMIGVTSYRRVRGKLKYETWWTIHLYSYLGIALSFMHQIKTGTMFVGQPAMTAWWIGIYVFTFGVIVWFRVLVPVFDNVRHQLRVERVIVENHNTISVVMKGRKLEALAARGGQYFGWRFLTKRYWWESHPYSLSASPRNDPVVVGSSPTRPTPCLRVRGQCNSRPTRLRRPRRIDDSASVPLVNQLLQDSCQRGMRGFAWNPTRSGSSRRMESRRPMTTGACTPNGPRRTRRDLLMPVATDIRGRSRSCSTQSYLRMASQKSPTSVLERVSLACT